MLGLLKKEAKTSSLETVKVLRQLQKNDIGQEEGHREQEEAEELRWFQAKRREGKGVRRSRKKRMPSKPPVPASTDQRACFRNHNHYTFHRKQIQCL